MDCDTVAGRSFRDEEAFVVVAARQLNSLGSSHGLLRGTGRFTDANHPWVSRMEMLRCTAAPSCSWCPCGSVASTSLGCCCCSEIGAAVAALAVHGSPSCINLPDRDSESESRNECCASSQCSVVLTEPQRPLNDAVSAVCHRPLPAKSRHNVKLNQ